MTVQELIDTLTAVEDKTLPAVVISDVDFDGNAVVSEVDTVRASEWLDYTDGESFRQAYKPCMRIG